ncbi:MAG: DUF4292 domain-containing protein [Flavobacteriales bacterium]
MRLGHWFAVLGTLLLLAGCRVVKPVAGEKARDLEPRSANELLDILKAQDAIGIRYYSAKADVSMKTDTEKRSFKAHVRVVRDSAAWLSITPALGIEVARALLTRDSLQLIDKFHDTYWIGDTTQAQAKFGVQPSLKLLQEALLGLPIDLQVEEKYRSDREDGMYTLTSKERRKFIRAAEDISLGDTLPHDKDMREKQLERTLRKAERREAMVYKYWIDPDSMRVSRVLISDLAHDQQADVRYMEWKSVDGHSIPGLVILSLSAPGQTAFGTLYLDRIQLNGPLNLPFRIPEKFTPME